MDRIERKRTWRSVNRMGILVLLDILTVLFSYGFALFLRFDFSFSRIVESSVPYIEIYLRSMPLWCGATLTVFFLLRLYHSIWRQASVAEMKSIIFAYALLAPCYALIVWKMELELPKSYYIMGFLVNFCLTTGCRFSFRILRYIAVTMSHTDRETGDRIMVIGAGSAGQMLIKELHNSDKLVSKVCCVIDDNPNKRGKQIEGVDIV